MALARQLVVACLALAACGPPPPSAVPKEQKAVPAPATGLDQGQMPPAPPPVESGRKDVIAPASLEALERDLAVAEQRMDEQLQAKRETAKTEDQPPPPTRIPATKAPAKPPGLPAGEPGAVTASASRCDIACRAFHSMRRAADNLCELTGDADDHCRRARDRVAQAARRIADAGCQCFE